MPTRTKGTESAQVAVPDLGTKSYSFNVSRRIYGVDALLGTAYSFLGRCYIHLDIEDKDHFRVTLWQKPDLPVPLEELAGEFMNELVNEALRYRIAKQTERTREMVLGRAIGHSLPVEQPQEEAPSSPLDDLPPEVAKILEEEDDSLDFLDDPLGIAVPWEEKFGKKEKEQQGQGEGDRTREQD